jgi:hypothetical protein
MFYKKLHLMPQRLLIQGVKDRVSCSIRSRAGSLRLPLTEVGRHTTEGSLVDLTVCGPRKRNAVVLKFNNGRGSFFAHETNGFLIAKPIGPLHRVVHVPSPIIFAHIGECGTHPTLRRHRM